MSGSSWLAIFALALTSIGSVVALMREKKDDDSQDRHVRRKLKHVLFVLPFAGLILGILNTLNVSRQTRQSEARHKDERKADHDEIVALNAAIQTLNSNDQLQYERHQKQLSVLNDKFAELKKDIATEDLRKKLQTVQGLLDKSLAPRPKAKLEVGFSNGPLNDLSSTIYAPMEDNHVKLGFSIANHTTLSVKDVNLWLRICDACKYASEPLGSVHPSGAFEKERLWTNIQLPPNVRWQLLTVEVEIPQPYTSTSLALKYSCDDCVIEKEWNVLTATLGRFAVPQFTPTRPTPTPSKKVKPKMP